MSGPNKRKRRPGRTANPAKGMEKRIAANLATVKRLVRVNCVLLVAVALASLFAEVLP